MRSVTTAAALSALLCAAPVFGADANAGKAVFHAQCALCHSAEPGGSRDGDAWGRPVDLMVNQDGSLLLGDDGANLIYRIAYKH